jgi:sortase A
MEPAHLDDDFSWTPTLEAADVEPDFDATPVELLEVPKEPLWRRALFGGQSSKASPVVWILAGIAGLSLWCAFFALVLGSAQAHRSQRNLYATIRSQIAAQTLPIEGSIPRGAPVALLQIPGIGVHNLVVVEGTSAGDLEDAPGHRRDTPLPGQIGTSVLMGRGLLFGAPFSDVPHLSVGDIIKATTGQGDFRYSVEGVRRAGDAGPTPITSPSGRLTLITSEGAGSGLGAVRRIVYVDALLIDIAQPASDGRPTTIDANESSMKGDTGALPDLVGWLVALIAAVAGTKWLYRRFGRWQSAIVCVPVLFALLWLAAESAAQLLPNLM